MSSRVALAVQQLHVERRSRRACFQLHVPELELRRGESVVLLGANGAGKSSLLCALAGLLPAASGEVRRSADGPVTMVFQRPAAFSGSVAHNVRAALLGRRLSAAELDARVFEALARFEIASLADRHTDSLSGGELRRLALARAFAPGPSVLLLDEPFDDLDTSGQRTLAEDVRRLVDHTGVAVALATHDLSLAFPLADRIAVLDGGQLVQCDARDVVLRQPRTPAVARRVGMTNLLAATLGRGDGGECVAEIDAHHRLAVQSELPAGSPVWAGIRPEHLKLEVGRGESGPIGKAIVRRLRGDGVRVTVTLEWGPALLETHLLEGSGLAQSLAPGALASLAVRAEHIHVLARETRILPDGPIQA